MKLCTKLVQWMALAVVFFSVWAALIVDALPVEISKETHQVILIVSYWRIALTTMLLYCEVSFHFSLQLPLYFLICFGVSLFKYLREVDTFIFI